MKYTYSLFGVFVFLCTFISASSTAAIDINVIQQIQYYSGSDTDIENSDEGNTEIINRLAAMAKIYNEDKKKILIDTFSESFDKPKLKDDIEEALSQELSEEDAKFLLEWFLSPLGRKISEEEKISHSLEHKKSRNSFIAKNQARIALVTKAWETIGTVDHKIESATTQITLLFKAVNALTPNSSQKIQQEQISNIVNSQRDSLRKYVLQNLINGSVYDYRNLSDEELNSYEKFIHNKITIKYYKTYFSTFNSSSQESMARWIKKLQALTET